MAQPILDEQGSGFAALPTELFKGNTTLKKTDFLKKSGCEMTVVCGKTWEQLSSTEDNGRRYCADCKKDVFLVSTPTELRRAARQERCVYINPTPAQPIEPFTDAPIKFRVSRERIREIEKKALEKMKQPFLGAVRLR